jgi:hypothetical protein
MANGFFVGFRQAFISPTILADAFMLVLCTCFMYLVQFSGSLFLNEKN